MRVAWLLLSTVLASCGREPAAEGNRTGFASSATGSIEKPAASAGEPRLLPFRAMTSDPEVLQGDPDAPGQPFVIRIRELPGTIIPPHSHPVNEHLTIVSGTLHFGFGDDFDPARLTPLPSGSHFKAWAEDHPTEFYKIAAKLIPTDVRGSHDIKVEPLDQEAMREAARREVEELLGRRPM